MGAAAAVIMRRQRDIVETFRAARATSPATARAAGELGLDENHIFHGLIRRAVIRPTDDGRYFLDEPSWKALRSIRRRAAVIILFVVVLLSVFTIIVANTRIHT